ncbi:MAG: energy transducer TonB [Gemmatimonadaceae bacterium]
MRQFRSRQIAAALAVAATIVLVPARLHAQSAEGIFELDDLTKQPKLAAPAAAAGLIARAYPSALRAAGVGGMVQLAFIVDTAGKVEKNSVEVLVASAPALGQAARSVAERLDFMPGEVNGKAVRARVVLPLTFKAR